MFTRIALRLCTLEALRPTDKLAANGPFPTLAGTHVFDTRIGAINDLSVDERRPIAVVYTELDNYEPGQRAGGPPFNHIIDLVIVISVVAGAMDGEEYIVGVPVTDAELDASLDLFEAQIIFALCFGPAGALWRKLTGRKIVDVESLPHRDSEDGVYLAERTVRMKIAISEDEYDPAPSSDPTGFDRLPQPLRSVVNALSAGAYGSKLGAGLATDAPVMPVATPLQTVGLAVQPADPPRAKVTGAPQIDASATDLDQ